MREISPICWSEINLEAIRNNLRQIKRTIGSKIKIMAVIKANAYGHGLISVAEVCQQEKVSYLAVANLDEALKLRQAKISLPILILGYVPEEDFANALRNKITLTLYDFGMAKKLEQVAKSLGRTTSVHIKIDTGMHRLGIFPEDAVKFFTEIKKFPAIKIEGIYSHFADASNKIYSLEQIKKFKDVLQKLEKAGFSLPIIHMANSQAGLTLPQAHFDMVRVGLAIYGLNENLKFRQSALSLKSKIAQIKTVEKGKYIGYCMTYKTKKPAKLATIAIGYADGYSRSLSNIGEVLVHGKRCPVRGRICMNQTIIDVSEIANVKIGDEVVLIGRQGPEEITVNEVAQKINTIPYEIVSRIPSSLPRIYKR